MKNFSPFFLFVLFFVVSCKDQIQTSDLDGEWKSWSTDGGMAPAQFETKLVINGSDYKVFYQGQLSSSSKFKLLKESKTIDDVKYLYKLDFENNQMQDTYIRIVNNTLRMQSHSITVDGDVRLYKKQ